MSDSDNVADNLMIHKKVKAEVKKVRKVIPKSEKYIDEQKQIKKNIDKILNISDSNNKFYVCDIDEKMQKKIEDMLDDIKKYYPCSTCRWFQKGVDRLYLALVKYVYKYAKIELIHTHKTVERDGKKIGTGMYIIDSA